MKVFVDGLAWGLNCDEELYLKEDDRDNDWEHELESPAEMSYCLGNVDMNPGQLEVAHSVCFSFGVVHAFQAVHWKEANLI